DGVSVVLPPLSPASTVEPPEAPVPAARFRRTPDFPGDFLERPPPGPVCLRPLGYPPTTELPTSAPCFGSPFPPATTFSLPGPVRTSDIGLLKTPGFSRGADASARIHASCLGSGCGTGTLNATSFFLASGTSSESG